MQCGGDHIGPNRRTVLGRLSRTSRRRTLALSAASATLALAACNGDRLTGVRDIGPRNSNSMAAAAIHRPHEARSMELAEIYLASVASITMQVETCTRFFAIVAKARQRELPSNQSFAGAPPV